MSTGADAMGVAAWLTPVLIVAVAAGLAHPAVGQPADPARTASADPERIDPDCDPAEAEKADPLLVEEPDGICPPEKPADGGEGGQAERPGAGGPADGERPADAPASGPERPGDGPGPASDPPSGASPEPHLDLDLTLREPTAAAPNAAPRPRPAPRRRPAPKADSPPQDREPTGRSPNTHVREPAPEPRAGPRRTSDRSRARERRAARKRLAARARSRARRASPPSPPPAAPVLPLVSQRALPEPIPPARRLDRRFARRLERVGQRFRVPWQLMLAVRRARGHVGAAPATAHRLRVLAQRLVRLGARRNARRAVRRLAREVAFRGEPEKPRAVRRHTLVRRVVALAHLNRAVGLRGLVKGLKRIRARLGRQVLESRRLAIYAGGRLDIRSGLTDVRVLVLLRYLASRYSEVTVSSLTNGHSFYTASGNVSAHSFGLAVDIAALNGRPILGNQGPGGLTERALRQIMLLPKRLQPTELISLFALGGPSFALADHADHIHAGY